MFTKHPSNLCLISLHIVSRIFFFSTGTGHPVRLCVHQQKYIPKKILKPKKFEKNIFKKISPFLWGSGTRVDQRFSCSWFGRPFLLSWFRDWLKPLLINWPNYYTINLLHKNFTQPKKLYKLQKIAKKKFKTLFKKNLSISIFAHHCHLYRLRPKKGLEICTATGGAVETCMYLMIAQILSIKWR